MSLEVLPTAWEIAQQGIEEGLHRGWQAFIWHRGRTVVDDALGEDKPGQSMTRETINLWMSATKPLVAIAVAQLWERGKVRLDDPVCHVIPEFAAHGKERVTLKHLLTHTSCIVRSNIKADANWEEMINEIADLPLEKGCIPGDVAAYQPISTWAILGELVRRIDGRPIDVYLKDELFTPLGMQSWSLGIPEVRQRELGKRIGWIYERSLHDKQLVPAQYYNSEEGVKAVRPASNGRGTARELSRFYRMLLADGRWDGRQVISEDAARLFTSPARTGMVDETFRHPIDWGLGFIVNSNRDAIPTMPYGFGLYASPYTFGHGGRESSAAFADPVHDLVVAVFFNGMPGEGRHQQRIRSFLTGIYKDLGIV